MLTRLARWWLARSLRKAEVKIVIVDECEVCGQPADHRIVSGGDDLALGITEGGTLMAADFCAEHCPGGCRWGCEGVTLDR